ncbi:hypothetical protein DRE_03267 [Drechslerella stenobrocha 248]|uniref:Uncharacterized protein n=1 Tax=Drechslerella stenobrocha 248 TaxID=1043628 RepID=W7I5C0_9PEZI|nr:hypothetical protein DRE_03267 [Drechslerella stenobrocha 248]
MQSINSTLGQPHGIAAITCKEPTNTLLGLPVPVILHDETVNRYFSNPDQANRKEPKPQIPAAIKDEYVATTKAIMDQIRKSDVIWAYVILDFIGDHWAIVVLTDGPSSLFHLTAWSNSSLGLAIYISAACEVDCRARNVAREVQWPHRSSVNPGDVLGAGGPNKVGAHKQAAFGGYLRGRSSGRLVGCTVGRLFFEEPCVKWKSAGRDAPLQPTALPPGTRVLQPSYSNFHSFFNQLKLTPYIRHNIAATDNGGRAKGFEIRYENLDSCRIFSALERDPFNFYFGHGVRAIWQLDTVEQKIVDVAFFDIEEHRKDDNDGNGGTAIRGTYATENLRDTLSSQIAQLGLGQFISQTGLFGQTPATEETMLIGTHDVAKAGKAWGAKDIMYHRDHGVFELDTIDRHRRGAKPRDAGGWEVTSDGLFIGVNMGGIAGCLELWGKDLDITIHHVNRCPMMKADAVISIAEEFYGEKFEAMAPLSHASRRTSYLVNTMFGVPNG